MNLRQEVIKTQLPSFAISPERAQLMFFASVIGERDPVYTDVNSARDAGHPDLLVPPTFLFSLELKRPAPYRVLKVIGADLSQALHGEQGFTFHAQSFAGEELTFAPRITDYYEKKDRALRFIVRTTPVTRGSVLVAELHNTLIVRMANS